MSGVAYAIVHFDPPQVLMAESVEILHRVLAMELVARTASSELGEGGAAALRQALLDEQWGDAVTTWMRLRQVAIDVYSFAHVFTEENLPEDMVGAQLQFTPLFRD